MAAAARTLGEAFPGRFVLGIGTAIKGRPRGTAVATAGPSRTCTDYLDAINEAPWHGPRPDPPVPIVIAALGPRMLELAASRSRARFPTSSRSSTRGSPAGSLGPDPVLAVHQAIVLGAAEGRARELARDYVGRYLHAPNYRNNLLRLGFPADDVAGDGSEKLLRALVAWGDVDEVAARLSEHIEAGSDHVCVLPLGGNGFTVPIAELSGLAHRMGTNGSSDLTS